MKNTLTILISILITLFACSTKKLAKEVNTIAPQSTSKAMQDSIIKEHLANGAWQHGIYSREWQEEIDKGLAKDSTIAYLWQQKAMPLFKQGKYEIGMQYIDKAVQYNRDEWQEYRAFIKCIFAKTYKEAIIDFEDCKKRMGNSYVMDHSYNFYIALSKLQLNEYADAEKILEEGINQQVEENGEEWVHHLNLFYLGIAKYEQGKYEEAVTTFDRALKLYPEFSDVLYYKGVCIGRLGDKEQANKLIDQALVFGKEGYTINEDNVMYERYPYQIRWKLWD